MKGPDGWKGLGSREERMSRYFVGSMTLGSPATHYCYIRMVFWVSTMHVSCGLKFLHLAGGLV